VKRTETRNEQTGQRACCCQHQRPARAGLREIPFPRSILCARSTSLFIRGSGRWLGKRGDIARRHGCERETPTYEAGLVPAGHARRTGQRGLRAAIERDRIAPDWARRRRCPQRPFAPLTIQPACLGPRLLVHAQRPPEQRQTLRKSVIIDNVADLTCESAPEAAPPHRGGGRIRQAWRPRCHPLEWPRHGYA